MTPESFAAALASFGWTRARFALIFGLKSATTVQNWTTGKVAVQPWAAQIVQYLTERPEARAWFEAHPARQSVPPIGNAFPSRRSRPRHASVSGTAS